jgi:hypothetical protein
MLRNLAALVILTVASLGMPPVPQPHILGDRCNSAIPVVLAPCATAALVAVIAHSRIMVFGLRLLSLTAGTVFVLESVNI